ncbi:hypothetical protein SARC_08931 [Sphaeroforma arctica JP610]|uniref:Calmodulin-lysine N-methyltransferase n=1 Tax=Sphaeroforma arctica JP610 TaxID=667725 RepID=A0A0L0FRQ9_9EUKA|nr:hypothetical protein SARC_08931 [Sphaeroforma arctica JP610]KNC78648.1 hypothetical protein SARC_08931 [Sphaeroforma arctica JP610]|eukprot:XP_014152550.1 hypothetical protein SARC_08931 [Sphaeroforma arctica JP610]
MSTMSQEGWTDNTVNNSHTTSNWSHDGVNKVQATDEPTHRATKHKRSVAKHRWRILADALLRGNVARDSSIVEGSTRNFTSFGLFETDTSGTVEGNVTYYLPQLGNPVDTQNDKDKETALDREDKTTRQCLTNASDNAHKCIEGITGASRRMQQTIRLSVSTRHKSISANTLIGFDNTGNVCVWPSEEVLAYYCLRNRHLFRNKVVLELGAGMTGLAGLAIAMDCSSKAVVLTDGNEHSVDKLRENIDRNYPVSRSDTEAETSEDIERESGIEPTCERLVWDPATPVAELFESAVDVIVCADCLFFRDTHARMAALISKLLKPHTPQGLTRSPDSTPSTQHTDSYLMTERDSTTHNTSDNSLLHGGTVRDSTTHNTTDNSLLHGGTERDSTPHNTTADNLLHGGSTHITTGVPADAGDRPDRRASALGPRTLHAPTDTATGTSSAASMAVFIQPRRGSTLQSFLSVLDTAHPELQYQLSERYDETVWEANTRLVGSACYSPDLHYPLLLVVTKR